MIKFSNINLKNGRSAPLFWVALLFVFGIYLSVTLYAFPGKINFFDFAVPTYVLISIIFISITFIAVLMRIKKKFVVLVCFIIVLISFANSQIRLDCSYEKTDIIKHEYIGGEILKVQPNGDSSISLILRNVFVYNEDQKQDLKGKTNLILYGQSSKFLEDEYYLPKSIIIVKAQLMYPTDAPERGFENERYDMLSQNLIYKAVAHYASVEIKSREKLSYLNRIIFEFRASLFGKIERYVGDDEGGLLKAVLTGDKSSLDEEIKTAFSKLGISHLLATSGLHIGILLLAFEYLLRKFHTPIIFKTLMYSILILLFLIFAGFRVSMIRASLMWFVLMISRMVGTKYNPLNSLGAAVIIMTVINPFVIFSISFVLSCVSVAAICVFAGGTKVVDELEHGKKAIGMIYITLSVILFTWPVLAYYFNSIPVFSPIANIIFVPLVSVGLIMGILFGLLTIIDLLAPVFGTVIKAFYFCIIKMGVLLSDLSLQIKIVSPPLLAIILWVAGMLVFTGVVLNKRKKFRRYLSIILLVCSLTIAIVIQCVQSTGNFTKVYSDGSKTFIYIQNEKNNVLITNNDSYMIKSTIIKSGQNRLDYLIFSGNDSEILEEIITDLDEVKINRIYASSSVMEDLNKNIEAYEMKELAVGDIDITFEEFKAKSKTAKMHYAVYIQNEEEIGIYFDPISLREGAFGDRLFDKAILSNWSKSRAENIKNLNFIELIYISPNVNEYESALYLEELGTKTYNITQGVKMLFNNGEID